MRVRLWAIGRDCESRHVVVITFEEPAGRNDFVDGSILTC